MKRVILIGTSHSIQLGEQASDEFRTLISDEFSKNRFSVIAEEIGKNSMTVAKEFCRENSVDYLCIDPDHQERADLNIPTFEQVVRQVMNEYQREYPEISVWPREPSKYTLPSPVWERYQKLLQDSFRARESVWLARILAVDLWPCLCIIGADHFLYFAERLSRSGISVAKSHQDWEPSQRGETLSVLGPK